MGIAMSRGAGRDANSGSTGRITLVRQPLQIHCADANASASARCSWGRHQQRQQQLQRTGGTPEWEPLPS